MTNHNDELGNELGRAMHHQADGIGGSPISFDAVKGTAGRIRRRRALAASAAVAAAVAIIVPTAMAGSDLFDGASTKDVPPANPSVTRTEGDVDGTDPVIDIRGLDTGATPGLVWIDGGTLHDGGTQVPVKGPYDGVVKLGERYVATGSLEGERIVAVLDESGAATAEYPLEGGLAPNASGSVVAWMSPGGTPQVLQEALAEPLAMAGQDGVLNGNVVGVTGEDCTTDPETTEGGGCSVVFTGDDAQGARTTYVSSSHGFSEVAAPGEAVTAVAEDGRRATIVEVRDDGTCSDVTDLEGTKLWSTCDYRVISFSPDGTRVLAHNSYGDGFGDTQLTVLDAADGTPVFDLTSTAASQASVFDQVWEDDEHVLAVVFQRGQWAVLRVGPDGSRELAVEPRAGEDMERPFFLSARP